MVKSLVKSSGERIFTIIKRHPLRFVLELLAGLVSLFLLVYIIWWAFHPADAPAFTGFRHYPGPIEGQRSKTLWDWLELIIIPLALAAVAYVFNRWQKQNEMARDEDTRRHQILREYYGEISELLLEKSLATTGDKQIKTLARARTLAALSELDSERKRHLVSFIFELDLISTPNPKIDLVGADLSGANLAGVAWKQVNLEGANLNGAILTQGNFDGANFEQAVLRSAKLDEAILTNATLNKCDLTDAQFNMADLQKARLSAAKLTNVNLLAAKMQGANLQGAILDKAELIQVQLAVADLSGAILLKANLHQADLRKTNLMNANLNGANMRGSILEETNLTNASLNYVDLRGTKLDRTILRKADLKGAKLQGSDFSTVAAIEEANFSEAIDSKDTKWPRGFNPSQKGIWRS